MTNEEYIQKWLDGTLSDEERKTFETSEDYAALKKMLEASQSFKAPEYDTEEALARLQSAKSRSAKVVRVNWVKPFLQAAAVVLIAVTGYFLFFYNPLTVYNTLAGEKEEIYLPDSSLVVLNAGSELSYTGQSWGEERVVNLEGEAYFKVKKGAKFHVKTESGIVSVLGTEFNVKQRPDYFEVFCYEGKVQVVAQSQTRPLTAGHGFRLAGLDISELTDLKLTSPGWIEGESHFQSISYAEVIAELERQYDVTIQTKNIDKSALFTGGFVHDDLQLALKSIAIPLNLTIELIDDSNIILSGGL